MEPQQSVHVKIDLLVHDPRWLPYSGYANTGQMAAFQQVRDEIFHFINVINLYYESHPPQEKCLQLGLGFSACSHEVWRLLFKHTITIDNRRSFINDIGIGAFDTRSVESKRLAETEGPFDLLFIDAGHLYDEVQHDHDAYAPFVRSGGIVAFHDAVHRPQYDIDHHVWKYLEDHHPRINMIGGAVGIGYYIKE